MFTAVPYIAAPSHTYTLYPSPLHSTALHCLKAFDVTRKATYQHLDEWYRELRNFCQDIPVILVANKIDVNYKVSEER